MANYKTFKVLTPEEAKDFYKNIYTWADLNDKYYTKEFKQNTYIQFKDGWVTEFSRPRISNTMYYDDEYEAPSTALESFKSYNFFYNFNDHGVEKFKQAKHDLETIGCCLGGYSNIYLEQRYIEDEKKVAELRSGLYGYETTIIRELTPDEEQEVIALIDELKMQYSKRLETYYKRYSNKIYTCGYWANR